MLLVNNCFIQNKTAWIIPDFMLAQVLAAGKWLAGQEAFILASHLKLWNASSTPEKKVLNSMLEITNVLIDIVQKR